MTDIINLPKWATPDRQAVLLMLWEKFGNKCLQGHHVCPIPEHYITIDDRLILVPKAKQIPCQDRNGNLLKGKDGQQLYITVYPTIKVIEQNARIVEPYEHRVSDIIGDWKQDDRIVRAQALKRELRALHDLGERRYPLHGRFSAISQSIYGDNQPLFFVEGMGINGLTFKPFAKVRLASSYMRLFIDLADVFKPLSKNKRRKAIRYGKSLPPSTEEQIAHKIGMAVKDYLAH